MTAIGPGVRVKYIGPAGWVDNGDGQAVTGPPRGSVWTVLKIRREPRGWRLWRKEREFVFLVEWPDRYRAFYGKNFVPLDGDAELEHFSALIRQPANPDAPLRIPERVA